MQELTESPFPHLTYSDYIPYLPPPFEFMTNEAAQRLQAFRRRTIECRIRWVNEKWSELKSVWPQGSGLEYLIAFELLNPDQDIMESLASQEFIKQVIALASQRGIPVRETVRLPKPSVTPEPSDDTDSDDCDSFDGEDQEEDSHARFTARWTVRETARFIDVLREQPPSWKAISRRFPGRTTKQCRLQYKKLRRQGRIEFEYPPQEDQSEEAVQQRKLTERVHNIIAINFSFKEQRCLVIPKGQRYRQIAMQNPLVNYVDQITAQKILFPAISPDFYLLDYTTWCRLLSTSSENPFTTKHLNKRQLRFITYENIHEFADKIVNLEPSRPPNPADDKLAEFLGHNFSEEVDAED
jgi:hypothetical protein